MKNMCLYGKYRSFKWNDSASHANWAFAVLSIYSFQREAVLRRQKLTSVDVRFWRLKTVSALEELNYL